MELWCVGHHVRRLLRGVVAMDRMETEELGRQLNLGGGNVEAGKEC